MRFPFWWRKRRNQELSEEIQAHLTLAEREEIESGRAREEAQHAARREFGNVEVAKEVTRDAWGWRWLTDFFQDTRYSLRTLRQRPGFVAVAILTLALGTGATTVMFTVINGVILKPLPYANASELVAIHGHSDNWKTEIFGEQNVAHLDFLDCQRQSRSLDIAGFVYESGTVSAPGEPQYVQFLESSPNLFSVLGVPLLRGRTFLPEEDQPGGAPAAILGYSFWQRLFAGSSAALGSSLVLDNKRYTIVGIASPGFRLHEEEPDLFTPMNQNTARFMQTRQAHPVTVVARLRPGITLVQAQTELDLIGRHLAEQFPDTNGGRSFLATQLRPDVGNVRSTLWLLLGAVSLVLLIACANIASLMLARAVSRERELALRIALGASRNRIARQCLTECAVLGLSGGLLGVALANFGARPFVTSWPGVLPRAEEVQLDWRVLLFTLGISLLSSFLFGLAPALRAPVRDVEQVLRAGSRTVAGSSRRLHSGFVISEIALAIVLLVSAGMLGRTLLRLSSLDPGVDVHNVLVTRMALSPATLQDPGKTRAAWQDVLERARHVFGVQSIATVDTFPMREGDNEQGYWTTADVPHASKLPFALLTCVSPDYLKVMGIPLRRGRFFDDHDTLTTSPVIVVDEVLAQSAFGTLDVVGKRLWIPDMGYGGNVFEIVGVVGHVRHWGLAGDDQAKIRAQIYYPFSQLPDNFMHRWSELMSIAVRTNVPPLSVVQSLRSELRGASNDQVLYEVHTMEQLAQDSLARQRFLVLLFGIFAGLALLLACIGIYGVLAYLTGQRIPEIGIRMALGARAANVIWLVLRQSLIMILIGIALGTLAALAAARILLRLVEGMQPTALSSFAIMIPVLVAAALFASFLPARRASRVDPLVALRHE
jgi:predicted permease